MRWQNTEIATLPRIRWCYAITHWHYTITHPHSYTTVLHYSVTLHICTNLNGGNYKYVLPPGEANTMKEAGTFHRIAECFFFTLYYPSEFSIQYETQIHNDILDTCRNLANSDIEKKIKWLFGRVNLSNFFRVPKTILRQCYPTLSPI